MELMIIEQLPLLKENFATIAEEIKKRTDMAKSLACTEETVKAVKQVRADMNKEYKAFEEQRKTVKKAIMKPYEDLEKVYVECVGNAYKEADKELVHKIREVEDIKKAEKELALRTYFEELKKEYNLPFLAFEHLNLNITLSASEKSLKDDTELFVRRVKNDLSLIDTQENKEEILVEYKTDLNVSRAIQVVVNRHKAIEAEKTVPKPETPKDDFFGFKPAYVALKIKVPLKKLEDVKFYLSLNDIESEEIA